MNYFNGVGCVTPEKIRHYALEEFVIVSTGKSLMGMELKEALDTIMEAVDNIFTTNIKNKAQIKILSEALKAYADEGFDWGYDHQWDGNCDFGNAARKALKDAGVE